MHISRTIVLHNRSKPFSAEQMVILQLPQILNYSGMYCLIVLISVVGFPKAVYLHPLDDNATGTRRPAAIPALEEVELLREIYKKFDLNPDEVLSHSRSTTPLTRYVRNKFTEIQRLDDTKWPRLTSNKDSKPTVWMLRPDAVHQRHNLIFKTPSKLRLEKINKAEIVFQRPIRRNITIRISSPTNHSDGNITHITDEGYIADVSGLILSQLPSLSIHLDVRIIGNTSQRVSDMRPMLSIFQDIDVEALHSHISSRKRRSLLNKESTGESIESSNVKDENCRLHRWDLNLDVLQSSLKSFSILEPSSYMANYCAGNCPGPLKSENVNTTTYSLLKRLYHAASRNTDKAISRSCCQPITYRSQAFLLKSQNEILLVVFPDAVVTACG